MGLQASIAKEKSLVWVKLGQNECGITRFSIELCWELERSFDEHFSFFISYDAGCAIFFRKSKFALVESNVDQLSEALINEDCLADLRVTLEQNPKLMERLTNRNTILQVGDDCVTATSVCTDTEI